ncbi:MAG: Asp-tRNA(Asn)/Glu-tRNA(Gln) amidotransferase subunit GatC [Candidatus Omnitrophica bacterium]|nr:Asp-tRNA(Asn)/Glu-tRNA(Gln) amidotransferase subunit GatC [Candidatus Omnitrophota bacterium]
MTEKSIVEYISKLTRINVSPHQIDSLNRQLSKIIGYIEKLNELDVENVEPMRTATLQRDVFRPDQPKLSMLKDDILNNAPQREGDYFKVPKIIE